MRLGKVSIWCEASCPPRKDLPILDLRMGTRLLLMLAAPVLSAAVTACGSSTAPPQTNPAALAAHFDSLANAGYCNDAAANPNPYVCGLILAAHFGVAEGVSPTPIRVTTSAGSANWLGSVYVYQYAGRVQGSIDTVYSVVAYDGENLGSEVETYVPLVGEDSYAIIDSTFWSALSEAQSGTGAATVMSVGRQCTISDSYPPYRPPINQQDCHYASIQLSANLTFRTFTGNDSTTISIPRQTMSGLILDMGAALMRSHDARNSGKVR